MRGFLLDLKQKWYLYLAIAVLIVGVQCASLDIATRHSSDEKVTIFLTCNSYDETLSSIINEDLPNGIKSFNVEVFDQDGTYYGAYFNTYGKESDLVTLTQKFADICECDSYFVRLDEEKVKALLGDVEFYYYNGEAYGIKIFDKETKNGMATDYIKYFQEGMEENVYMFFGKNSKHIGDFSINSLDNSALVILEKIWRSSK